jgi:glycerophosphoryl diester phosphodiesterase
MLLIVGVVVITLAFGVWRTRAGAPWIIAHRGASADAPENTLAAFRLAWAQGADGIEGDFRLTRDGRIVCIHDADTQRVAGTKLVVKDSTLAELQALDVGSGKGEAWRGEKLPSLEEVLAVVPDGKRVFIELKSGSELVAPLAAVLKNASLADEQIVLICLDADVIAACKRLLPRVRCHWLTDYKQQDDGRWTPTVEEVIATIRQARADGLGTESRPEYVDEKFVRQLRAGGIDEFHVWTVDDAETARLYRRLGAWALTTNCPGKLRAALADE